MVNNNATYQCNTNLNISSGITSDGSMTFTEVGVLPSNLTPQIVFITQQEFTDQNASWLFYQAPGDFSNSPGWDAAGVHTPCQNCSVSRVTSIAQKGVSTYSIDGAYFGVDFSGNATINWMQVAFGEWLSDCMPGTSLCSFEYSSDPTVYYGGPEPYPDSSISQSNVNNIPGFGPYETWDGINLTGNAYKLLPAGAFQEPLPPLPCTLDSSGLCAFNTSEWINETVDCTKMVGRNPIQETLLSDWVDYYAVYRGRNQVQIDHAHHTQTVSPSCIISNRATTWIPGEPRVQYNDTNLP